MLLNRAFAKRQTLAAMPECQLSIDANKKIQAQRALNCCYKNKIEAFNILLISTLNKKILMQKSSLCFLFSFFVCVIANSQTPQSLNYQAIARNALGNALLNSSVAIRVSIHDSTANGPVVYAERDTATTNQFGLFTCKIGTGNIVSGIFSAINWGHGDKYLQVELDPTGGSSYTNMGTTQLVSVPYALNAKNAENSYWTANANNISNSNSGKLGIGTSVPTSLLHVITTDSIGAGFFESSSPLYTNIYSGNQGILTAKYTGNGATGVAAVYGSSLPSGGYGKAGYFYSNWMGVMGETNVPGISAAGSIAVYGFANSQGNTACYGVRGEAAGNGGGTNYAVYGAASGNGVKYAGYFSGNVYATGTITSSDRKLKQDIRPITGSTELIMALKPSIYSFRKNAELENMGLPAGNHYGLIAQEVESVIPDIVSDNIQPPKTDRKTGEIILDEVHFKGINYTELIPVLISAMQEQQKLVNTLQQRIEYLERK